jgi:DnaJ like chaperone protein
MPEPSKKIPRHWWGKIIGAALGLFRGGLSGAIIGGLIGHMLDRFLSGFRNVSDTRQIFFKAMFCSLGHIAKADGRVTQAEINAAEQLMQRLQLNETERQRAIRYFNQGKQPDFQLEPVLQEFARHSIMRHDLRLMFVEILVDLSAADNTVTAAEQHILLRVARTLHIPAGVFEAILSARRAGVGGGHYGYGQGAHQQGSRQQHAGRQGLSLEQAYATLGISNSATDAECKRAYRKLVGQYHPDKLVSQGLPEEMMEMAKTRVRDINTAYDQIKQTRGFK